jgi:predicted ABC-type ATPase
MPTLFVLAGPNGSGKSSIYEKMKDDLPGEFVNADMIEAGLPAGGSKQQRQMQAGRATVTRVRQLIQARQDFVFETTLSSAHSIRVMKEAKDQGYDIGLVFVILNDPILNIKRVRWRVLTGGHEIPDRDVLRRYEASLSRLPKALMLANQAVIIDNSAKKPVRLMEIADRLFMKVRIDRKNELHLRLSELVRPTMRKL